MILGLAKNYKHIGFPNDMMTRFVLISINSLKQAFKRVLTSYAPSIVSVKSIKHTLKAFVGLSKELQF